MATSDRRLRSRPGRGDRASRDLPRVASRALPSRALFRPSGASRGCRGPGCRRASLRGACRSARIATDSVFLRRPAPGSRACDPSRRPRDGAVREGSRRVRLARLRRRSLARAARARLGCDGSPLRGRGASARSGGGACGRLLRRLRLEPPRALPPDRPTLGWCHAHSQGSVRLRTLGAPAGGCRLCALWSLLPRRVRSGSGPSRGGDEDGPPRVDRGFRSKCPSPPSGRAMRCLGREWIARRSLALSRLRRAAPGLFRTGRGRARLSRGAAQGGTQRGLKPPTRRGGAVRRRSASGGPARGDVRSSAAESRRCRGAHRARLPRSPRWCRCRLPRG